MREALVLPENRTDSLLAFKSQLYRALYFGYCIFSQKEAQWTLEFWMQMANDNNTLEKSINWYSCQAEASGATRSLSTCSLKDYFVELAAKKDAAE